MTRIRLPAEPLVDGPTALRSWRDADLPALAVVCDDPEIARWTRIPYPYRETDARAYLLTRHDRLHSGAAAPFAIADAGDLAALLGSVTLMHFDWDHRRAEVGYWLARHARGQGHTTRAVRLICRFGFERLGLERVELMAGTANSASQRVAERAGFTREALLRSYYEGKGERHDMVAFGLLRSDS